MQSGIALFAFMLLQFWSSWTYYLYLGAFLWPCGLQGAKQKAHLYHSKGKAHLPALLSALVEFQKAQCFFILAVEAAAQIVFSRNLLQARNLQQLYNNYALVGTVALSGLLPISFILLCLHKFRMKSWYIFILSTCTIALSAGTLYTTNYSNADPKPESTTTDYAGCGATDPSVFCLTVVGNDSISAVGLGGGLVPAFTLVIWLFLSIDQYDLIHRLWVRRLLSRSLRLPSLLWRWTLQSMPQVERILESRWKWKVAFDRCWFFV